MVSLFFVLLTSFRCLKERSELLNSLSGEREEEDSAKILERTNKKDSSNMLLSYLFNFLIEGLTLIFCGTLYFVARYQLAHIQQTYAAALVRSPIADAAISKATTLSWWCLGLDAALLAKLGLFFQLDLSNLRH
eukprot:TRINITY_DN1280_c0_g2_i1.p1 TRINITY_DN1280_c0_g2~~TRINITY_DN1280_c0_g2_i1.p1  ORF type:complete len:134 (+),score=32.34 TRINITY_DN1280_c0_g2_i1:69-470(+)